MERYRFGRVVVKVGSNVLTRDDGTLDTTRMSALSDQIAQLHRGGVEIILVSSGAVAAGRSELGTERKLDSVSARQLFSAVGQVKLINRYYELMRDRGILCGQVLTTKESFSTRRHYLNQQHCMTVMLDHGVIPIVNENDSLASNEIRFGDNDRLSALVANLVRADALVLLTDVDGLYTAPPSTPGARRIGFVPNVIDTIGDVQVAGSSSGVGTGGMVTKLDAARVAAVSGIPAVLTSATNTGPALMGDPVGTVFAPVKHRGSSRRLWIGFASDPRGALVADAGAAKAVRGGRASLLAAGVVEVHGEFSAGDPVWIDDEAGAHLARGLAGFDSEEIPQMLGRNTAQLRRFLGDEFAHPVVHRDNLVLV